MHYELETKVFPDKIQHELFFVRDEDIALGKDHSDIRQRISTEILDAKEQATIDALIKLGWFPPQGMNMPILELCDKYENEGCGDYDKQRLIDMAFRYVDTFPDCQVRWLLYTLAKELEDYA